MISRWMLDILGNAIVPSKHTRTKQSAALLLRKTFVRKSHWELCCPAFYVFKEESIGISR